MISPKPISEDRISRSTSIRHTPLQTIHFIGNFMRIWSIYSMYHYLAQEGASVVAFIFTCLVPSSIIFLTLQKPWKGRPLSNSQVIPSVINGGITALYFVFWGKGIKSCGPLRAIMAEYSGAVLGVLSVLLYGRRSHIWKKVVGLIAMMASFYLLSQGWATATFSPFSFKERSDLQESVNGEKALRFKTMAVPITAGILSALRRVIARRVSLKSQLKRRLHTITIASATCFLFPFAMWDTIIASQLIHVLYICPVCGAAMKSFQLCVIDANEIIEFSLILREITKIGIWLLKTSTTNLILCNGLIWQVWAALIVKPNMQGSSDSSTRLPFSTWVYLSVVLFGIVLIFYVDNIAEERLRLVFSSPKHLMVAGGCIIMMEIMYKMDFSLLGFLVCASILSLGIIQATSLEQTKRESLSQPEIVDGTFESPMKMSPLPT